MSRRDNVDARCADCKMLDCICRLIPTLHTPTRLVLVVHYKEARKPTNTGQLAARCLAGSRVAIVGDRERPLPVPLIGADETAVLLYPSDDAVPLAKIDRPLTIVVPDGNWRQAAKMGKRIPGLEHIPRVTLVDPRPTEYKLRAEPQVGGLATMEAIARAWGILEGIEIEDALLAVFREMVRRTLATRGAVERGE